MDGPKQDARWWRRRASLLADLARHDARRAARRAYPRTTTGLILSSPPPATRDPR